MSKDPAFLFYSKDWLQGTMAMMPEEKGIYIDLLAHQHQDGDLPNDTKRLSRLVGMPEVDFLRLWDVVKQKFIATESNRLVNRKLTDVTTKRLTNGVRQRITGTLAYVIKSSTESVEIKQKIKNLFVTDDFLDTPIPNLTKSVTDWYTERLSDIKIERLPNGGGVVGNAIVINSNKVVEDMIVLEMIKIWKNHNPNYPIDEYVDYPACLQIAFKIAKAKGWKQSEVVDAKLKTTLESWEKIVKFTKSDTHYSKFSLDGLLKKWSGLVQTMEAARSVSTKEIPKASEPSLIPKFSQADYDKYSKNV